MQDPIAVEFQQTPLGDLDPRAVDTVRADVRQTAELMVTLSGRLEPAVTCWNERFAERAALDRIPGPDTTRARVFLALAGRTGVLRAFRWGEAAMEHAGRRRRVAGVLEFDVATGDWWLAFRRFGTGTGDLGVFHGDWEEETGRGLASLPEPFQPWLDPGDPAPDAVGLTLRTLPPVEDLRMAVSDVRGDLPANPLHVADILGRVLDAEMVPRPPDHLLVFAFRPGLVERWEARGRVSCPIDDLVRAIAAQGSAEAVALVHPAVMERDDTSMRCVAIRVERGGRVGVRLLPLRLEKDGFVAERPLYRDEGPVGPEGHWLGVAPSMDLAITPLGPLSSPVRELPEA